MVRRPKKGDRPHSRIVKLTSVNTIVIKSGPRRAACFNGSSASGIARNGVELSELSPIYRMPVRQLFVPSPVPDGYAATFISGCEKPLRLHIAHARYPAVAPLQYLCRLTRSEVPDPYRAVSG